MSVVNFEFVIGTRRHSQLDAVQELVLRSTETLAALAAAHAASPASAHDREWMRVELAELEAAVIDYRRSLA